MQMAVSRNHACCSENTNHKWILHFFLVAVLVCLIRINENSCLLYRHAQYNTEVNFGPGWVSRARTQQPQCWHKSSQSGLIYQDQEPLKIRGY